ncbi:MAG: sodium:solute symporter [Verrucomicrobia bacterium]|nr:sodium:solute symporter [Verrucomicrobiota bacterium]
MNLHWFDWLILFGILGGITLMALRTRRYTRSVADFLSGNRCAGRYLLTMAEGAVAVGAMGIVARFEQYYQAGFPVAWWLTMLMPVGLVLSLSGWVVYRFRETRALTMAQFFEMRYSRRFRVFAGMLAFFSGIINYGIFPAVTARFVIYFFGFPVMTTELLGMELDLTMAAVMLVLLSIALLCTLAGGHVAVMVTDFLQASVFHVVFISVSLFILFTFGWGHIVEVLKQAPEGNSMLNPFKQANIPQFNAGFFLMQTFIAIYGFRVWQGDQGYRSAARTPHEARMAGVLGQWRLQITWLMYMTGAVGAYVLLNSPHTQPAAESVRAALEGIPHEQVRVQMTVPLSLAEILPVGLFGLMSTVIIAAAVSTDNTYLHSWGSIFIQDVVLPLRKERLSPEQHILWLRRAVIGVAVFAFVFSTVFPLREYIVMFTTITGAIYIGGAGSVIIGGLYWKNGTTAGAWTAMSVGSFLAVSGIVLNNILWPRLPDMIAARPQWTWLQSLPSEFPLHGVQISFYSALIAMSSYVLVSLLTCRRQRVDMDRILHRGEFSVAGEHKDYGVSSFWRRLGVGREFTRGDKIIYLLRIGWTLFFVISFAVGTVYNLFRDVSEDAWARWWLFYLVIMIAMAVSTTVWFIIGGSMDLKVLFRTLSELKRDEEDDGFVPSKEEESV